jgi:hypothetical protein
MKLLLISIYHGQPEWEADRQWSGKLTVKVEPIPGADGSEWSRSRRAQWPEQSRALAHRCESLRCRAAR